MRRVGIPFYSLGGIHTGDIREIEIHQDQVGFFGGRLFYCLCSICGLYRVIAAKTLQYGNKNGSRVLTVFNYQDFLLMGSATSIKIEPHQTLRMYHKFLTRASRCLENLALLETSAKKEKLR